MKLKIANVVFHIAFIPLLAFLCLLPVLVALGMWQLDRADEKKKMLDLQMSGGKKPLIRLTADFQGLSEGLQYRKVYVTGRYDTAHQFLLDNRIVSGKAGYFVLTPFLIEGSNRAVLVNRGWVGQEKQRSILPDISFKQISETVLGRINHFPGVGFKLKGAEIPAQGWPSVIQLVDSKVLEKIVGYPLYDFQLQLDKDQANGFWREWKNRTVMPPEKHVAYAVQWFGLAGALTILFIVYGCGYDVRR